MQSTYWKDTENMKKDEKGIKRAESCESCESCEISSPISLRDNDGRDQVSVDLYFRCPKLEPSLY